MGKVYHCDLCDRDFILDDEPLSANLKIKVPYCPYCGRKTGNDYLYPTVFYVRDNA